MDLDRVELRRALRARYPWVAGVEVGPDAVEAGECDRCGEEPRLVQPCGPPAEGIRAAGPDWALGRRCALALGPDAWCGGHEDEAHAALAVLSDLPPEADDVCRLWWVATGEVRVDPSWRATVRALGLPVGRSA